MTIHLPYVEQSGTDPRVTGAVCVVDDLDWPCPHAYEIDRSDR